MRRSGKNGERAEEVRGDRKRPARVEPLRPQAEHIRKLPNDLAKFPEENPYPVLRIHRDGTVLYANKASEPLLKAKGSAVDKPAPSEWHRLVNDVLVSGQVVEDCMEYEGRIYGFKVVPIVSNNYVNFYGADITEHKQTEEALRYQNEMQQTILDSIPVMVMLFDRKGHYKLVNRYGQSTLGWSFEEILQHKDIFAEFYPDPKYREYVLDYIKSASGTESWSDFKTRIRDGHVLDTSWINVPLSDGSIIGIGIDITERKKAEEVLRESEDKFKTLADEAFDSIAIHDGQRIIEVNKAFGRLWGYDPKEAAGMKIDKFFAPECWEDAKKRIQSGYDRPYEADTIRKDGTRFTVEIVGHSITYKGRPVRIATARDITERKRAEEEILWKTALLESQVEANLDGVLVVDSNNQKILTNKRLIELLKVPQHIVEDKDDTALLQYAVSQTKYPEQLLEKVKYLYSHQDETSRDEIEFKNGMVFDRYSSPVVNKNGKYFGRIWTFRDITERKRAEEAIQISETRFRELFNNMSSGVAVYEAVDDGSDFVFKDFNMAGQRMDKTSREDIVGKRVTEIFPGVKEMGLLDVLRRVWQTGRAEQHPTTLYKDGRISGWRENNVYKLPSGEIVAVYDDVTERKGAEEKLLEYQRQLKQLTSQLALTEERERRRIAGELHDQLCQSLALAKIRLDTIRSSGKSKPAEEELMQVSDAMQRLIDQTRLLVFDLSSPILYELGFEAAVAEWLNEQVHDKSGIETEFQDDGQPKSLDDDVRMLLFRNVRELLINVIKHSRASKVKVCIRRVDDSIEITVKDNGIGFNPAEAKTMAAKTAKFGLFSIRESVEQLGGRFEIESKPDAGCTATIAAPLKGEGCQKEG
jgi:PAS domain S-box-containing protein